MAKTKNHDAPGRKKRGKGAKKLKEAFNQAIEALKNFQVNPYELRDKAYAETEAALAVLPPTISVVGEEFTTTLVARDFELSARKLHELLREFNLSWKSEEDKENHLDYKLCDRGYAAQYLYTKPAGRTPAVTQLRSKWTWRGRVFLALLLSKVGIQPFGRVCPGWLGNHDDVPF